MVSISPSIRVQRAWASGRDPTSIRLRLRWRCRALRSCSPRAVYISLLVSLPELIELLRCDEVGLLVVPGGAACSSRSESFWILTRSDTRAFAKDTDGP
ncbi:hypothetical protein M407DRAFT_245532 [Tulasnella calospora MUT 4182]|uniref:Uncharacterized protein n=1 Tax=Tulasnella calospora MUT 4182 TaxID=1051891 RepID=A0A0C3LIJ6_9AGAM|nr:hypothetical protein M407DRAFT_245532 [Tulasnella calospora MUT 4182]